MSRWSTAWLVVTLAVVQPAYAQTAGAGPPTDIEQMLTSSDRLLSRWVKNIGEVSRGNVQSVGIDLIAVGPVGEPAHMVRGLVVRVSGETDGPARESAARSSYLDADELEAFRAAMAVIHQRFSSLPPRTPVDEELLLTTRDGLSVALTNSPGNAVVLIRAGSDPTVRYRANFTDFTELVRLLNVALGELPNLGAPPQ